jgi:hypothetical protein
MAFSSLVSMQRQLVAASTAVLVYFIKQQGNARKCVLLITEARHS